jgi:hypothetical protein
MAEAESRATQASQEAVEVRAALRATAESLAQSDSALRVSTAALAAVQREAVACREAQLRAEAHSAEADRRLAAALDSVTAFKQVVAHALARCAPFRPFVFFASLAFSCPRLFSHLTPEVVTHTIDTPLLPHRIRAVTLAAARRGIGCKTIG